MISNICCGLSIRTSFHTVIRLQPKGWNTNKSIITWTANKMIVANSFRGHTTRLMQIHIYECGYGYRHYHRHPLAVVRFKLHPWHSRHFYYFVIAIMKLKKASSYSHGTAEPRKNIHSKFVVERRHALTTKTPNAASSPIRLLFIGLLCRTQSLSVRPSICPFNDRLDSTMSGLSQIQLKTLKFYDYDEVVLDGKSRDFTLLDVFLQ